MMMAALLLGSCCFGVGSECDPATYTPHCTPTGYDWCWRDAMLGPLAGPARIDHTQCESGNSCIDLGSGQVGCAAGPPFVSCSYDSFQARCDGLMPVDCYVPSNLIVDEYEVHRAACAPGHTCSVIGDTSGCSP